MTDEPQSLRQRLLEILRVFFKIGAMSYGGAAIMGIMQLEIQQRRGWMSKERYLEGMALVNMLPGRARDNARHFHRARPSRLARRAAGGHLLRHSRLLHHADPYAALFCVRHRVRHA
jgi:hypothetical protein